MGNKLTTDSNGISSATSESRSGNSSSTVGLPPMRRNTVAIGSFNHRSVHSNSTNGEGAVDSNGQSRTTMSSSSMSVRVPRGMQWIAYANQLQEGDHRSNNNHFNTTRIVNSRRRYQLGSRSLPPFFLQPNRDAKCHMCNKVIPAEDIEVHFVMCLTKPRVTYNEEILSTSLDECAICLEDLEEKQVVARLPCLCVYHKKCIDQWFSKSQTCPEHPPD